MMLASIAGPDILIVLLVVLVLFGGTQLPKLARSIGQAKTELKRATDEDSRPVVAPVQAQVPIQAEVAIRPVVPVQTSAPVSTPVEHLVP
jgi:sec-independent protein translocase protein TatA